MFEMVIPEVVPIDDIKLKKKQATRIKDACQRHQLPVSLRELSWPTYLSVMLPSSSAINIVFCLFFFSPTTDSSRILAVFPTVSKSHFDFFQPLLLTLASRGHDVTVVNSYPQPRPVRNYTDINLSKDFKTVYFNNIPFDILPQIPASFLDNHLFLLSQIEDNEPTFSHPDIKRLLNSDEKFHLIITELWNSDVFLGFAHKFKAPVIVMSSCSILPWGNARFSNPDNPSYISNTFLSRSGKLDFLQRLFNTCQVVVSKLFYKFFFNHLSERIAKRVFGESLPPLEDLALNTSLLFVNTHHTLHGSRPFSPQVIQIGGIYIKETKPLQEGENSCDQSRTVLGPGPVRSTVPIEV
ncbi:hypothetical protein J6590_104128 [Homalodisca vitripennis]|nr:hypothetical protein J6590_104128 [Homalodisca vitripennis]